MSGILMQSLRCLGLQGPPMQYYAVPILLLSAYVLVDGICAVIAGVNIHSTSKRGRLLIADGVFRIVLLLPFAVFRFFQGSPFAIFSLALIVAGIIEIAAAVRLRKHLSGNVFFGLAGALSILFFPFLTLIVASGQGRAVLTGLFVGFLVIFGALLLAFGFLMRGSVRTTG